MAPTETEKEKLKHNIPLFDLATGQIRALCQNEDTTTTPQDPSKIAGKVPLLPATTNNTLPQRVKPPGSAYNAPIRLAQANQISPNRLDSPTKPQYKCVFARKGYLFYDVYARLAYKSLCSALFYVNLAPFCDVLPVLRPANKNQPCTAKFLHKRATFARRDVNM